MPDSPVRFGLIGYGAWGRHHAASIVKTEGARLVAIAERSEESRKAARETHPDAVVVADYRELVGRDDLEVVDVVVPNRLHHELATAVLSAGKHLLLEKPMCLSMEECDDVLRLAKERGLQIAVNHEFRLSSLWGRVKDLVDDGVVGEPQYVLVELSRNPYRLGADGWRFDISRVGDWILEEPIHFFDLARWYLSSVGEPESVYAAASSRQPNHPELQDNCSAIVKFAGGAYAVVSQTLAAGIRRTGVAMFKRQAMLGVLVLLAAGGLWGAEPGRLETTPLDDFEDLSAWNTGDPAKDLLRKDRAVGAERMIVKEGRQSLAFMIRVNWTPRPGEKYAKGWPMMRRTFPGPRDWSAYDYVEFWLYPKTDLALDQSTVLRVGFPWKGMEVRVLNDSAYAGVAIPLVGSYDTGPVAPLESLEAQTAMLRRVLTIDPWPWVVLNRFIGARADGGGHASSHAKNLDYFRRVKGLDLDGKAGNRGDMFTLWRQAVRLAKTWQSPGIMIDLEAYNNYRAYDTAWVARERGEDLETVIAQCKRVGEDLAKIIEEEYPQCTIWSLFSRLEKSRRVPGHKAEILPTPSYITLGLLEYAKAHRVPLKYVCGGETTPGYCNRTLAALKQKFADRDRDMAPYLEQYPEHLFLGGTISPFHDYSIASGFIESGYRGSDFKTIEDFEPMFKALLDAYDYVWVYASSAAKTLPYDPAHNRRYSSVLRKALDASAAVPQDSGFNLRLRYQRPAGGKPGSFDRLVREENWKASETAIIVCDVWDQHHCLNAVRRLEQFGPRLNEVLKEARRRGAVIVHSPSDCMNAYQDHPARRRAIAAPRAHTLPEDIQCWCSRIQAEVGADYPIDQSDGGEDDDPQEHAAWAAKLKSMGRNPRMPWKTQSPMISIDVERDYISDRGDEVWNILEHRGIRNVILAGVHTNMCVLGRPFGLRQMRRNGKNVVLMRDMTDTMYNPRRWPYVDHFTATDLIVSYIERYVCPTTTSDQLIGGEPFRFRDDRRKQRDVMALVSLPKRDADLLANAWSPVTVPAPLDARTTLRQLDRLSVSSRSLCRDLCPKFDSFSVGTRRKSLIFNTGCDTIFMSATSVWRK